MVVGGSLVGVSLQYAGHSYLTYCLSRELFAVVVLLFNSLTELCIIQQLRGRGGCGVGGNGDGQKTRRGVGTWGWRGVRLE